MLNVFATLQVIWDPHSSFRTAPRQEVTFFVGCLAAADVIEPYMPDRALRQVGHVQSIPEVPLPQRLDRGVDMTRRTRDLLHSHTEYFTAWDTHVLRQERRGRRAVPP